SLECFGNFSTSRAMSLLSWRMTYSSPHIRHDITDKRSEISEAPRSLSPRSLCLSSSTTIFSFDIFWPRRAFRTSDPQRTESKPSASQMRLAKKSGMTSTRIPIIRLIFIKHFIATFLVLLLLASTKGREGPPVSVPADCQQFLNKYFDAWKSKD